MSTDSITASVRANSKPPLSKHNGQCLAAAAAVSTAVAVRAPVCCHARCSRSCSLLRSASSPVGFIDTADASPIPTVPPNEDQVTIIARGTPNPRPFLPGYPHFETSVNRSKVSGIPNPSFFAAANVYLLGYPLYAHTFASLSKP